MTLEAVNDPFEKYPFNFEDGVLNIKIDGEYFPHYRITAPSEIEPYCKL